MAIVMGFFCTSFFFFLVFRSFFSASCCWIPSSEAAVKCLKTSVPTGGSRDAILLFCSAARTAPSPSNCFLRKTKGGSYSSVAQLRLKNLRFPFRSVGHGLQSMRSVRNQLTFAGFETGWSWAEVHATEACLNWMAVKYKFNQKQMWCHEHLKNSNFKGSIYSTWSTFFVFFYTGSFKTACILLALELQEKNDVRWLKTSWIIELMTSSDTKFKVVQLQSVKFKLETGGQRIYGLWPSESPAFFVHVALLFGIPSPRVLVSDLGI